ncbi:MAG: hypothetical protein R3272_15370 [Candidatus Promineifilaceae bacterium]|nr:hypothetical protein [Candidatus Promineifilaceae bacterium]
MKTVIGQQGSTLLLVLLAGVLLVALAAGCQPQAEPSAANPASAPAEQTKEPAEEPVSDLQTEPTSGGKAYIDSVEILLLESFPLQAQAVVSGNLSDGCTTIEEIQSTQVGNTFEVNIITSRPADALCTEALVPFSETVSLDIHGLRAGTYSVEAGEQSASFTLETDNVIPEEPAAGAPGGDVLAQIPFSCQAHDESRAPYLFLPGGFCLQYPRTFRVGSFTAAGSEGVIFYGPALSEGPQPLHATLTLEMVGPANGRTLAAVVEEATAEFSGLDITPQEVQFGGESALLLENMPGVVQQRVLYTIHDETVYRVAVSPTDAELSEAASDVELVWSTVRDTFTFITDETAALFSACPDSADAYVNVMHGFCFQMPEGATIIQPTILGAVSVHVGPVFPAAGTIQPFMMLEPFGAVEGQSLEAFVDSIVGEHPTDELPEPQPITIGNGIEAIVVEDLPNRDSNRHLFVMHNGQPYHFDLFPSDPENFPEETEEAVALWNTVLDSFAFFLP